jgi:tetratricopeptide (TPR) repeat protein
MSQSKGAVNEQRESPADPDQLELDALYNEGMAYYRRRQWREARMCFIRLQQLQPNRRGLDGLLRELDIFLQLESVEAESGAGALPAATPLLPHLEAEQEPLAPEEPRERRGRNAVGIALTMIFTTLIVVGGALLYSLGLLPFASQDTRERNYRNLGQAYMVAQQYCKALPVYAKLEALLPGDAEANNGLERAKAALYEEATAFLKANNTPKALESLQCIVAVDPNYRDVRALVDGVNQRRELDRLYAEARTNLDTRAYGEAVKLLLKLRATDPQYKPGTLSDDLYEAYMQQARQLLEIAASEIVPLPTAKATEPKYAITPEMLSKIRQASKTLEKALAERPTGAEAKLAKTQADATNEGLERYSAAAWAECATRLTEVYQREAGYLGGKVALVLCDARMTLGDAYAKANKLKEALAEYQAAAAITGCNAETAKARAQEVGLRLTPTATATTVPTALPTAIPPTPVPTNTAAPSPTPVPTRANTPAPSQPQPGPGPQPQPQPTSPPAPPPEPEKPPAH